MDFNRREGDGLLRISQGKCFPGSVKFGFRKLSLNSMNDQEAGLAAASICFGKSNRKLLHKVFRSNACRWMSTEGEREMDSKETQKMLSRSVENEFFENCLAVNPSDNNKQDLRGEHPSGWTIWQKSAPICPRYSAPMLADGLQLV